MGVIVRYKFRCRTKIDKVLNAVLVPLQNLLFPGFCSLIIVKLLAAIGIVQYFNNDFVLDLIQKILLFASFGYALSYCILRKGVFLYDTRLVIARYTFTLINYKSRISIKYEDIESVIINYIDLRFTKYRASELMPFGDDTYNIELTLKNGKKYFFSIEDQEEFVEEVSKRMEKIR